MTEQSEKSVGSAAFEIFANRIASEVVEENKALEAELESLETLREHLSSVEIHVDIDDETQIIKPVGIGGGIILEEDDGIRSLMLGFPETPPPIPLLKYMKAKLMLSNQVIATIPGNIFPIMKMYGPDEMGIVLSPLPDVCVEGILENLTDNDRAKITEDDVNTFATYLQFGTGLEGEIMFIPQFVRIMTITPRIQQLIDLLGPLRRMVQAGPPQEPDYGENKYYLNELSPYDELRDSVLDAYENEEYLNLMNDNLFHKDERNVLFEMRTLVSTVELCVGDETQLTVSLDDGVVGHDHLVENGDAVWAFCLTGRDIEVPINKIQYLKVMLSGATLTKRRARIFPANTLLVLEIEYYSGVILRGSLEDPWMTRIMDMFGGRLDLIEIIIMGGGEMFNFSSEVFIKFFSLSLEMASNEGLLNLLRVNLEPEAEETSSSNQPNDANDDE